MLFRLSFSFCIENDSLKLNLTTVVVKFNFKFRESRQNRHHCVPCHSLYRMKKRD
ncbi:unnamed protein product [Chilo suppressalis]|uniref:Uncharacterized protein n=1 Tax=Chilo suppressalis TaxID=168631 RepID=A0ABN8ARW7_CHISP|nr:unnamed protein product [Chilo suppressalis]